MTDLQKPTTRIFALDWMRGLVMVLMAVGHTSQFYNAGRFTKDSALFYNGEAIPMTQFLVRWVGHLCAPTFVFLAGVSIALSAARRLKKGETLRKLDHHLLIRGGFLISIDLLLFSFIVGKPFLQVLYVIGFGMIAMIVIRRLPMYMVLGLALGWIVLGEAITSPIWSPTDGNAPPWLTPLIGVHMSDSLIAIYPGFPWLAVMMLGWCFGRLLAKKQNESGAIRVLFVGSIIALLVFALVRGFNGYGNMSLMRLDGSLGQWLHVSKYPPGLSFLALELGLMGLLMSAVMWISRGKFASGNGPILVFGQSALFFYLLHLMILMLSARVSSQALRDGGLMNTFLIASVLLVFLYPLCRWYRCYKKNHPGGLSRFV